MRYMTSSLSLSLSHSLSTAQAVVSLGDVNKDGQIDFDEFANYIRNHEEKLRLVFKKLDLNEDGIWSHDHHVTYALNTLYLVIGKIDREEVIKSLKKLGIASAEGEVDRLIKK